MPKTMLIKANPGLRIPLPESSYRYVEGDKPVAVDVDTYPRLEYWTRRIQHGECVEVQPDAAVELGTPTKLEPADKVPPPSPFAHMPEATEQPAPDAADTKEGA